MKSCLRLLKIKSSGEVKGGKSGNEAENKLKSKILGAILMLHRVCR
jgi:hypothetical protein